MIRSNPRCGPPRWMIADQSLSGSRVAKLQSVKFGSGRSNPTSAELRPRPSLAWHAAQSASNNRVPSTFSARAETAVASVATMSIAAALATYERRVSVVPGIARSIVSASPRKQLANHAVANRFHSACRARDATRRGSSRACRYHGVRHVGSLHRVSQRAAHVLGRRRVDRLRLALDDDGELGARPVLARRRAPRGHRPSERAGRDRGQMLDLPHADGAFRRGHARRSAARCSRTSRPPRPHTGGVRWRLVHGVPSDHGRESRHAR